MKSIAATWHKEIGVITSIYDAPFGKTSNNTKSNMPQTILQRMRSQFDVVGY